MGPIIYIKFYEFLLLPIYLLLIFRVVKLIGKKYYPNNVLGRYLVIGVSAKVFGSIAFALLAQYFFKEGDTFMYFSSGLDFKQTIITNFPNNVHFIFDPAPDFNTYYEATFDNSNNYGYIGKTANLFTAKVVALLSIITLNGYLITNIFFGLFAFTGMWRIFVIFSKRYPTEIKKFGLVLLFLPSILYWGGGIMKDTLCLGAIGWLFSGFYSYFILHKRSLRQILIMVISLYILYNVKTYIAATMALILGVWLLFNFINSIQKKTLRVAIKVAFYATAISLFITFYGFISQNLLETIVETIKDSQDSYARVNGDGLDLSNFGDISPTFTSLISKLPLAINNALFRPYIWEARKLNIFLSALENFCLLAITIYILFKVRLVALFKAVKNDNLIWICFWFSILFAIVIGSTCFNAGSLVRYKLPLLPFYGIMLILLNQKKKQPAIKTG